MTTLEKQIDIYFPASLREVAKKQLHLLLEIATINGETKAYKECNQGIKEVNQEIQSEIPNRRDGFIYKKSEG